jgi:Tol biopolymer transport system component
VAHSRTMLATLNVVLVCVLIVGFTAAGEERVAFAQVQQTAPPNVHNGKIAFAGILPRDGPTGNNWGIYTVNADGSGFAKITNNPASELYPTWSADGRKIAFMRNDALVTNRGTNEDIYVMNADGTGEKRLTDTDVDSYPAWSPDGSKIAFRSGRAGGSHDIFIMNADGGNVRRLTNNGRINFDPFWSPDGTKVAFISQSGENSEIYTVNIDGTGEKALTNNNTSVGSADWSPDGRRIVFQDSRGVGVMNANGTEQSTLFPGGTGPAWSPDGKKITFVGPDAEIATINPEGSGLTLVTNTPNLLVGYPDWQPLAGAGTGDATGNAGNGTATVGRNDNANGANEPGGANDAAGVINETTSMRQLPGTGGAAILVPAVGLLLISGAVARLLVRPR